MTLVAQHFDDAVGIDTHARTHTYAIVNTRTGARDGCQTFPVSTAGIHRAISWIQRNTSGAILAAVEGTRSYGATITHALTAQNITVVEVQAPRRRQRAGVGKSDEIDATTAAMTVLLHEASALLQPRSDGLRAALSVLVASRERIDTQRTRNRNALNALLRQIDLGIDARRSLTDRRLKEIGSWRVRCTDTIEQHYARAALTRWPTPHALQISGRGHVGNRITNNKPRFAPKITEALPAQTLMVPGTSAAATTFSILATQLAELYTQRAENYAHVVALVVDRTLFPAPDLPTRSRRQDRCQTPNRNRRRQRLQKLPATSPCMLALHSPCGDLAHRSVGIRQSQRQQMPEICPDQQRLCFATSRAIISVLQYETRREKTNKQAAIALARCSVGTLSFMPCCAMAPFTTVRRTQNLLHIFPTMLNENHRGTA